nr:phenylacetate-CoA oxygenase subunit PaaJ [Bacillota bacterium]
MAALDEVMDPEIRGLSLVDLGMVERVEVDGGQVRVQLIPTYVGCPALGLMKADVERRLAAVPGVESVTVEFLRKPLWTTDRITPRGRERLKAVGIAPPAGSGPTEHWTPECPYCGSTQVHRENVFGPTSCRSIFYCDACRNPFEAIKPV